MNQDPSDKTINKTIAEFMGCHLNATDSLVVNPNHRLGDLYTKSLDALVPVWEKLWDEGLFITIDSFSYKGRRSKWGVCVFHAEDMSEDDFEPDWTGIPDCNDESPSRAAARATFRAIKELQNE